MQWVKPSLNDYTITYNSHDNIQFTGSVPHPLLESLTTISAPYLQVNTNRNKQFITISYISRFNNLTFTDNSNK